MTAAVVGGAAVCAAVGLLLVRNQLRSSSQCARADEILKEFKDKCGTQSSKLKQVADAMTVEMHAGLASEGGSKLKMLISYVDNLPSGSVYTPLLNLCTVYICICMYVAVILYICYFVIC